MQRANLLEQDRNDATIASVARIMELPLDLWRSGGTIAQREPESLPRLGRLDVRSRRFLMVTIALVMWASTIFALRTSGLNTTAFLAGEGTMILTDSQ